MQQRSSQRSSRHHSRTRFSASLIAITLLLLSGASLTSGAEESQQPADWDAGIRGAAARDANPDPRVVETDIVARVASVELAPGTSVEAWTYNGGVPGPVIRAKVGDRLVVHFTNQLPKPTTIHWHGIRLPNNMDGVPGSSQAEVQPGQTFTYDFVVPDAGLYWYHPHVMSNAQVGFGLYGALLVEDPAEPVAVQDELVLVLSDIEIDRRGRLEDPNTGGSVGMAFGREGNHILVNGRERPTYTARSGVPQRWRLVNAAKSRYFYLDFGGEILFKTIGADGGLQEYPVETDTLVLTPGERKDVIVVPRAKPGSELVLQTRLFNRGYGSVENRIPIEDLFAIRMTDQPDYVAPAATAVRRAINPLDVTGARTVRIDMTLAQLSNQSFEYRINGKPFPKNVPLTANLGETQIWELVNTTPWSHPFHLHGFFFQVLDDQNRPVRPLAWKDTVDVPLKQTVRVAVRFDPDRPGSWMFHCHILDHAEGGLMGTVDVGDVTHSGHHQHSPN